MKFKKSCPLLFAIPFSCLVFICPLVHNHGKTGTISILTSMTYLHGTSLALGAGCFKLQASFTNNFTFFFSMPIPMILLRNFTEWKIIFDPSLKYLLGTTKKNFKCRHNSQKKRKRRSEILFFGYKVCYRCFDWVLTTQLQILFSWDLNSVHLIRT